MIHKFVTRSSPKNKFMFEVSHVVFVWNPTNSANSITWNETKVAGQAFGIYLKSLEVQGPNDFEPGFEAAIRERAGALIVLRDSLTRPYQSRIFDLAAKSRIPVMYADPDDVDAGGLMSYGVNIADLWRRAAIYVDKILKGAKPAELPVEQPTKFEFIVNLKAAKQIGLTIPPNVLARADKVIK
jgi:putative tryptophan/tyrosine transport system substrate-binding protein